MAYSGSCDGVMLLRKGVCTIRYGTVRVIRYSVRGARTPRSQFIQFIECSRREVRATPDQPAGFLGRNRRFPRRRNRLHPVTRGRQRSSSVPGSLRRKEFRRLCFDEDVDCEACLPHAELCDAVCTFLNSVRADRSEF